MATRKASFQLDIEKLIVTIEKLRLRIEERFPDSGLARLGGELGRIGEQNSADRKAIARPNWWLRAVIFAFIGTVGAVLIYGLLAFEWLDDEPRTIEQLIPLIESALNDAILVGAALVFLVSIESRFKRQKIISAVNQLRALAHVIDMHQLTKDPSILSQRETRDTAHSPRRDMTAYELGRYLDYCSELLALTSKLGFVYVQGFDDPKAMAAVNELEDLSTGLSRKVWQKIILLKELGLSGDVASGR